MADEVTICNQALSQLGANLIISLDDTSKEGILCKANYTELRDAVLEEGRWSFATKRYILTTKAGTDPLWGFSNRFLLDTEWLLVTQARSDGWDKDGRSNIKWSVEDGHLLCDEDTVYIKVIRRIIAVSSFTTTFRQALAARIAAELAPPLTESTTKEAKMWDLYEMKLGVAWGLDGSQGSNQRIRGDSLTRVR